MCLRERERERERKRLGEIERESSELEQPTVGYIVLIATNDLCFLAY